MRKKKRINGQAATTATMTYSISKTSSKLGADWLRRESRRRRGM